jgi:hypothetical protein
VTNLTLARRPRLWSAFVVAQVLAIGAVAVIAGFVWLNAIRTLTNPVKLPPPVGSPQSLVWSGRVFTNRASLEAWLKHRGFSYEAWSRKHAEAAAVVEHRPVVVAPHASAAAKAVSKPQAKTLKKDASAAKVKASAKQKVRTQAAATTANRSAQAQSSGKGGDPLVSLSLGAWLIALLLGAAALAPARVLARVGGERFGPSVRTYFGAAAVTLALAMLLASTGG